MPSRANRNDYVAAKDIVGRLLLSEPSNRQALQLNDEIEAAVYKGAQLFDMGVLSGSLPPSRVYLFVN